LFDSELHEAPQSESEMNLKRQTHKQEHEARLAMIGRRFGRLVVLSIARRGPENWGFVCRCDCGKVTPPKAGFFLQNGKIQSCGCRASDIHRALLTKHGKSSTSAHRVWCNMKGRCSNPRLAYYKDYGGRGIKVCDRWQSFENFYADMGDPPPGLSIDRINNNGNYEPGNCRWTTIGQQLQNTRRTRLITFNGETRCVREWARVIGIGPSVLQRRIQKWSVAEALTTPLIPRGQRRANVPA
jgi:hypothetical protein